jgi:hypothetical protein
MLEFALIFVLAFILTAENSIGKSLIGLPQRIFELFRNNELIIWIFIMAVVTLIIEKLKSKEELN